MAEFVAGVAVVSSFLHLIELSTKVVSRFNTLSYDLASSPQVFRDVRQRLPLIVELVTRTKEEIEDGRVNANKQRAMLPIVESCLLQVTSLEELLTKAIPKLGAGRFERGRKALQSVIKEAEMKEFDQALKSNYDLLNHASQSEALYRIEGKSQSSIIINNMNSPPAYEEYEGRRTLSLPILERPPQPPVFMVPYKRDLKYLARPDITSELEDRFKTSGLVAMAGLGGVGKSQIAIEYCYTYRERCPEAHVFWVYASKRVRFEEGYEAIAKKLNVEGVDELENEDLLKAVQEHLNNVETGDWLMVVDNADDVDVFCGGEESVTKSSAEEKRKLRSLARFLPTSTRGSVLVTTRDKRVGERLAGRGNKPIEVLPMNAADCLNLLRTRADDDEWDEKAALRLIEELAYLPLAITQAAAYMSEYEVSVAEYIEMLDSGDSDLPELLWHDRWDDRRDKDTVNSVIRTWKLSFEHIRAKKRRAAEILSLMSILDHHGVPMSLLQEDGESLHDFREAIGTLLAFSLIKKKSKVLRMHRLVALSTQKWLDLTHNLEKTRCHALHVLFKAFPDQQTFNEWPILDQLAPHALNIFGFEFKDDEDKLECADLLADCALYDLTCGRYIEAHEKASKSLQLRLGVLPEDDTLTLESMQVLGEALLHIEDFQAAREMLSKTIKLRSRVLGDLDPNTLESMSDLTITLLQMNELEEAEELAMKAVEGRTEVLGKEHEHTVVSLNIQGMLLQQQGKLAEARKITERVLRLRRKMLKPGHPDTIATHNNLAVLDFREGKYSDALTKLESIIEDQRKMLGEECYEIQVSLTNKAWVVAAQGHLSEAQALLWRVLDIREKVEGFCDPATRFTLRNLAEIFEKLGETDKADDFRERSCEETGTEGAGALMMAGLIFD